MKKDQTAEYSLLPAEHGSRYRFLCAVTGAQFSTRQSYLSDTPEQQLQLAWEHEGRSHFNQCQRCGKWVVDAAFNPEVLECIVCAPFETEARFCKSCGARVQPGARLCPACGKPLYYEGVDAYDAKTQI